MQKAELGAKKVGISHRECVYNIYGYKQWKQYPDKRNLSLLSIQSEFAHSSHSEQKLFPWKNMFWVGFFSSF